MESEVLKRRKLAGVNSFVNARRLHFKPIKPSLKNISDYLSLIGALANVKKVSEATKIKKTEIYGWVGFGDVSSVVKHSQMTNWNEDFFQLQKYENGEIAAALINVLVGIPDVFEESSTADTSIENLLMEAAFAQDFIFMKDSTLEGITSSESILCYQEPANVFCFIRRKNKIFLLTLHNCFDATEYFTYNIWREISGEFFADFKDLLLEKNFRDSNGRIFAIVPDNKLRIMKEFSELQNEYKIKYGNYESDKSLSTEDWNEISILNASISEAESFELVIEEESDERAFDSTDVVNLSSVMSEERYNLFHKCKKAERTLWKEQEKFKYSLIPGNDVAEARIRFREAVSTNSFSVLNLPSLCVPVLENDLLSGDENEVQSSMKKRNPRSILKESTGNNLPLSPRP
ncbi:unnamed protein product [Thelazia callipaeda]|uniref:DUF4821 domain-containing protein n=1 Tax=Thelazia callipaeda TaxID=103827 RepID=A0A0N5D1G7_THECL|nr:unnamed protein product [Thelazia callipaeda]